LAFGRGILDNVADGYRFLMDAYEAGDRVFLFGFSRGAYTVRALAAMLFKMGLLRPGSENLIPYFMSLFRKFPKRKRDEHWEEVRRVKKTFARACDTHFLGIWDTVNSVGAWGTVKSLRPLRALGFQGGSRINFTASNPGVQNSRHAVATDERRIHFRTNLWNQPFSEAHQEVWFPGVHSDIGGGYDETGLSDITLQWMLREASTLGLRLRHNAYDDVKPDYLGKLHNSLLPIWWVAGWRRRRMRAYKLDWPVYVHGSVRLRMGQCPEYELALPDNAVEVREDVLMHYDDTAAFRPLSARSERAYFAFVEDRASFSSESASATESGTPAWRRVMEQRQQFGLDEPTDLVWLDLVSVRYFLALDWLGEACDLGDLEAAERRKWRLREMDERQFAVAAVLLSPDVPFEESTRQRFAPSSWHLIVMDDQHGIPAVVLPDFDIDTAELQVRFIRYAGALQDDEYRDLTQVFSLNFLEDL